MKPRFLFIQTYYPDFLDDLYAGDAALGTLGFEQQRDRIFATGFSIGDAYSHYLRELGCEATEVIANADVMQRRWALEHDLVLSGNIHDQRRRIVAAQISHYRPDVVYVFEWCPLGDRFLAEIRQGVRLLVGQVASSLPADRTFAAYDLMISSWPSIVDHFRDEGRSAGYVRLGFDQRVLEQLGEPSEDVDVSFVGGFAPAHEDRIEWLEHILTEFDVVVYGYGMESIPEESPIRRVHRGPVWGLDMYRALRRSKVTLNLHARIDVRGKVATTHANNMRLFEATGVGTCLLTEEKANLHEMFEPGRELLTFTSNQDCVEQLGNILGDDMRRRALAEEGQQRTLRDHTYAERMAEVLDVIGRQAGLTGRRL